MVIVISLNFNCSQLRFSYTSSEITYLIKLVGSSQSEHCVNVKQRTQHDGPWDVISLVSYVFCHMQGNGIIKNTRPGKKSKGYKQMCYEKMRLSIALSGADPGFFSAGGAPLTDR